jgi:hypothetical protein
MARPFMLVTPWTKHFWAKKMMLTEVIMSSEPAISIVAVTPVLYCVDVKCVNRALRFHDLSNGQAERRRRSFAHGTI